jgi:hypothetical protein
VTYLVAFVADPARDDHAAALRDVARDVEGAGFFDDGQAGAERTVGTYVRAESLADPAARELLRRMAAFTERFPVPVEVQHGERVIGRLQHGRPDAGLRRASGTSGTA